MPKKKKKDTRKSRWAKPGLRVELPTRCWFCDHDQLPDYKEINMLQSFLSPRGKVLSRQLTATCAKHQRRLTNEVKISRQMALLR